LKTNLKILAAVSSAAMLGLGSMYVLNRRDEPAHCSGMTLNGDINAVTFVDVKAFIEAKDCPVRPATAKKLFVVEASGGGNGAAALAVGILLHKHNWDVEVVDHCISACANFIFPAGKTKYLNRQSMLMFHGGPHQENMLAMIEKFEREMAANGAPAHAVVLGNKDKEGVFEFSPNRSPADEAVLEFLSLNDAPTYVERFRRFTNASDQFYQELGVNPLLPSYGQIGGYETNYKSYKYGGFIYRLDSLRRLGIRNIELKDGKWQPERHPIYKEVYEVTYP
jgi:hypothetical protein